MHSCTCSDLLPASSRLSDLLCLQVRSIGKRDCSNLFKLGDEMIQFMQLHHLLASSVAEMMPINVAVLFSDEAKRQAR